MSPASAMRSALGCTLVWAACTVSGNAAFAGEQGEPSAADLLPPTTVLYAEIPQPARLVEIVWNHPARQQLEALDEVQQAYRQQRFLELKAAVSLVETRLGISWTEILAKAAGGGISLAVDAPTQGVALLVRSRDPRVREELLATLTQLARRDAQENGRPDPITSGSYRGIDVMAIAKARLASWGDWLLVTNKQELGKLVLDNVLDPPARTLAQVEQFQQARAERPADQAAWAYVDVAALRQAGVARKLFEDRADNPLAELLVGGIQSTLRRTPYVTACLQVATDRLSLQLAAPHQADWVEASREYFFGPAGSGTALPLLETEEMVFSLSAYRDVSQMWLRAGDLFDDRVNDGIAQAESNLSTLFSGRDFGEEILGAVQPEMRLVVTRQEFDAQQPTPAIRLPAFGLLLTLKDPDTMRGELRRTFQSLIGFLNVTGAMNGQPQLDLGMDQDGDVQVVSATYLPEQDASRQRLPINFNFSPSVAFCGDRFVVASTERLARALAGSQPPVATDRPAPEQTNTAALIRLSVLRAILADNREQLVAQNMLEEGRSAEEAERQIETVLKLVGLLESASLEFSQGGGHLRLQLELQPNLP